MEEHFQQMFALKFFFDMVGYGQPVVGATMTLCDTKGITCPLGSCTFFLWPCVH
jgi:hypothetical protein